MNNHLRLTDDELKMIARSLDGGHLICARDVRPLLDEVRARRAADPSADEVAALAFAAGLLKALGRRDLKLLGDLKLQADALSVIDRLIKNSAVK